MKGPSTTRAAMTSLFCVVTLLALDTTPAAAQAASTVGPGSRARVTVPSLGLNAAIGTVREATDARNLLRGHRGRGRPHRRRADPERRVEPGHSRIATAGGRLTSPLHHRAGYRPPGRRLARGTVNPGATGS